MSENCEKIKNLKTIGLVPDHLEWRKDNRDLIRYWGKKYRLVLFVRYKNYHRFREVFGEYAEVRFIRETRKSFKNRLIANLHSVVKQIPRSRKNYYLMEHFKLYNFNSLNKKIGKLRLKLHRLLPNRETYDEYLQKLELSRQTKIDDIDAFLFTTDILDDAFYARVLETDVPAAVYVTSWDHPCKHTTFSRRATYLTWSRCIGNDVAELQGISADRIKISGAGALSYITEYKKQPAVAVENPQKPYIFYGCSIGFIELVQDEIDIIKDLATRLQKELPGVSLLVRPYPFLEDSDVYDELKKYPCIQMDPGQKLRGLETDIEGLYAKYRTIDNALAFLHIGTTLGLEASFFDTPSVMLDYGYDNTRTVLSLHSFMHQYQLEKYMLTERNNVARSVDELMHILHQITAGTYDNKNQYIRDLFPLTSFTEWTENIEKHLGVNTPVPTEGHNTN